jgi:hypothetical protein
LYKHAITALAITASGLLLWAGPASADPDPDWDSDSDYGHGYYHRDYPISEIGTHNDKQASDFFVADWNGIRTGSMDAGRAGLDERRYEHNRPWHGYHGWNGAYDSTYGWGNRPWMTYGGDGPVR